MFVAEEGIQLHHHGENSDDDEDNVDDIGMDLDEARAPGRTMVDIQIQLLYNGPQMVTIVDQIESFAPTEDEEDEAVAEAIELDSLITNVDEEGDYHDEPEGTPCVWHVPNASGEWVDARKVVALLNQNTGACKLSKDRVTKIIQSFNATGGGKWHSST